MSRPSGKSKVQFACQACGRTSPKWMGRCPDCGAWNQMVEEPLAAHAGKTGNRRPAAEKPVPLADVAAATIPRLRIGLPEADTVLGGGLVPGSLVLLGGDPGIGKSTLLMQIAFRLSSQGRRVLYISGEESPQQIKLRADRLGAAPAELLLYCETRLEDIERAARELKPAVLMIDSIQTMAHPDLPSIPGSVGQIRECGASLMALAKAPAGPAVLLAGHVTKEGLLAGPRVLEHIVDTVLYFEGDPRHGFRVLRAVKNRFGSTHEVGIFEMHAAGLQEVADPSRLFLAERHPGSSGSVVSVSLEGTRPLLLEIQALVSTSYFGTPQRRVSGLDYNRSCLLAAVLERRAGLALGGQDIFLSVAGGLAVEEPALDLAVCAAIASSAKDRAVGAHTVVLGEVGLGGEIRAVSQPERRLAEAEQLGFRRCLLPKRNLTPALKTGLELTGVESLSEALEAIFTDRKI